MPHLLVSLCCLFATLGSFLFGYDSGVISSTIEQSAFLHHFNHPSDSLIGGIVSSYNGGAILGSLGVSYLSDPLGRRPVMFIGGILATLGGALQAGATTVAMLIAGRIITGLAVGVLTSTIPQWVGYGCSLHAGPFTWRFPLALQVVPPIILCSGVLFLPESPRWLIEKGRPDAGRRVLARLHLNHSRTNVALIDSEFAEITASVAEEQRCAVRSWSQLLFTQPDWRRRVLLACGIQAFTQCSGTNIIRNYNPGLYRKLGLHGSTPLMIQGIWGALAQFWNTVFMVFIDRVGRRTLLLPSLLGMGATMCIEGALGQTYDDFSDVADVNAAAVRAAIALFFVFSIFFTSLGLISWVYQTEIFSTAIRARGASLATATNWSLNLVFAQCTPIARSNIGFNYFYCFAAFNWAAAILVWFFYPETAGKSLEEVDRVFAAQAPSVDGTMDEDGGGGLGVPHSKSV